MVTLGHLNSQALLDGEMPIFRDKAEDAIHRAIAEPLGISAVKAAWGILTVLATNIMVAMRTVTVERGYDPREFTLVPFGGMGPTIAGRIAPELGIGRILIPRDPGAFSAYGMLVTDVRQERSNTRISRLDEISPMELDAQFKALEEQALADLMREQFPRERLATVRQAGMRYRGQSYEVSVPLARLRNAADVNALVRRFHEAHRRRYGHMAANEAVEIVNFQVTAVGRMRKPKPRAFKLTTGRRPPPGQVRPVYFGHGRPVPTAVYDRASLAPGIRIKGPAVIEEKTSTTVVYPDQTAAIDSFLNLEIRLPSKPRR
jgi:N-methylhydantoinase A